MRASFRARSPLSVRWLLLALCTELASSAMSLRTELASSAMSLRFDVVVYGGTPAGIAAAITAANSGRNAVALIEPLTMIGGMGAAGGLGLHDQQMSNLTMITGLAKNWSLLNGAFYGSASLVNHPDMWVAEQSFLRMIANARTITTMLGCRLVDEYAVLKSQADSLRSIDVMCNASQDRITIAGAAFIDASYDGEVLVAAGVDYTYGRESVAQYNESLAGVRAAGNETMESFRGLKVRATFANGSVVPYVLPTPPAPIGTADEKLMAFQYRACLTTDSNNSAPIGPPPGYDPESFVLLQRTIDAMMASRTNASGQRPPGEAAPLLGDFFTENGHYSAEVAAAGRNKLVVCCGRGPVDSDQPNINAGWVTAGHQERQRIADRHRYYLQGSLFYLGHDARVPSATRADARRYGLCRDEFRNHQPQHWPPQLYVRSSVRMVGDRVLTQRSLANPRSKPADAVSMACWEFDQHTMARHVVKDSATGVLLAINEGFFRAPLVERERPDDGVGGGGGTERSRMEPHDLWYDVPYYAMLPKRSQATNLLVPVALSASAVAFTSLRIETMYMDLGSAAGVATRQLLSGAVGAFHDVQVTQVQRELVKRYGQRVRGPWWSS